MSHSHGVNIGDWKFHPMTHQILHDLSACGNCATFAEHCRTYANASWTTATTEQKQTILNGDSSLSLLEERLSQAEEGRHEASVKVEKLRLERNDLQRDYDSLRDDYHSLKNEVNELRRQLKQYSSDRGHTNDRSAKRKRTDGEHETNINSDMNSQTTSTDVDQVMINPADTVPFQDLLDHFGDGLYRNRKQVAAARNCEPINETLTKLHKFPVSPGAVDHYIKILKDSEQPAAKIQVGTVALVDQMYHWVQLIKTRPNTSWTDVEKHLVQKYFTPKWFGKRQFTQTDSSSHTGTSTSQQSTSKSRHAKITAPSIETGTEIDWARYFLRIQDAGSAKVGIHIESDGAVSLRDICGYLFFKRRSPQLPSDTSPPMREKYNLTCVELILTPGLYVAHCN
ncbi:hypothetical protein VNI00_016663 [Paramarasmius palmivorus]|uniref:Transposase n=1 Tax=Paramarasmius palmivorus TaxID=297713 RepID=A0AAW0BBP4_9AGAR